MTLYGAPIWAQGTQMTKKNRDTLRRMQRRMVIRLSRGYRTISTEVAITLAGLIPFDLLAVGRAEAYWGSRDGDDERSQGSPAEELLRAQAQARAKEKWKQELLHGRASEKRAVATIIHSWDDWTEMGPSLLTYRITQVITGHGCFGEYLRKIGAEETPVCHHCGAESDTAQHTVEMCEAFETQRRDLVAAIGPVRFGLDQCALGWGGEAEGGDPILRGSDASQGVSRERQRAKISKEKKAETQASPACTSRRR